MSEEIYDESKKGLSIASLVLGIIGLFCLPVIPSILAVIFGAMCISKKQGSKGLAIAGIVLGVISLIMTVICIIFWSAIAPLLPVAI
ncbi:MAG TPA: DUF4190 domain-containing protein [Methanocorpusculum sp.]|nr:DUF4190 domain-containing protein [Methanocorpusculum sp.]